MKFSSLILSLLVASVSLAQPAPQKPLRVAMFAGSTEYNSLDSLTKLKAMLEQKLGASCTLSVVQDKGKDFTGIENLETADVAIFFTRRVNVPAEQLDKLKKFVSSGKGVVGVRTASHGFQTWLEFDPQILGGSYGNHYKEKEPTQVLIEDKAKDHPVLKGVKPFSVTETMYRNPTLAPDVTLLLKGKGTLHSEPLAWIREAKAGERGRVFYTSMGAPAEFDDPDFQQLLLNAVAWAGGR